MSLLMAFLGSWLVSIWGLFVVCLQCSVLDLAFCLRLQGGLVLHSTPIWDVICYTNKYGCSSWMSLGKIAESLWAEIDGVWTALHVGSAMSL
jgi:hypothetical protein